MIDQHTLEAALDRARPLILGHGGDIEVTAVTEEGVVCVALAGACRACPNLAMTFVGPVRSYLMAVPGVSEVRCEQVKAGPRALSRLAGLLHAYPYPAN
ncbi:NifU family protein [Ensifer sp. ENS11]|jgi:Fe-S cluster biogenesis protein NfuA|uniref:NifU family protein n=1 Tax=Ensifer sp. ENS11 TaxID=2769291 RepID=UPI00046D170D|nr:NifU family protein [Ensifer sp. ENS11]MBD9490432.1 NifU family protein [Ensifer sp. ENS11]MDP9632953.1 Fe-S cluster biogenesis protein NfuA [Ensifer adhaerens]